MSQQTITGELRRWHHDLNSKGEKCVVGYMFNDTNDIWEDGEGAIIFYIDLVESANFYLAVCANGAACIKLMKDEEVKHASKKFNGSNGPEKG